VSPSSNRATHLVRLLVYSAALGACLLALLRSPASGVLGDLLVLTLALPALLGVGAWLIQNSHRSPRTLLWVLCADVLCAGAVMALLPAYSLAERLANAAGFLVATLVAAVGRRRGAAVAGVLAGVMVCLLGLALLLHHQISSPDLVLVAARLGLLAAAAFEVAWVSGAIDGDMRRGATQELVARELKRRETESGELLSFSQALAQSDGPAEVAEATLRHVRRHFEVRAHALALESEGEVLGVWEERGRLEADHASERRERLQQALSEAGSRGTLTRLDTRSLEAHEVPVETEIATWVSVPIRSGTQTLGVLVLCDPRRGAIPPQRIGLLTDLARCAGEALARIGRSRSEETRRTGMLLRQMREGVLLLGPDGQALLANPAARDALSLTREGQALPEHLGEVPLAELSRTPPGVARHFRVQVARGETARPLELAGTAVGILEGRKRVGTLITLRDVTEEELARRRLVQSEKMNLVGQTLAGVAHELNNPLAALVGYADLLKHAAVPEAIARPVQQMREQAIRATRIVRNLLNFARRRNPQRVSVQIKDLICGTVELFAYEARMNEVTLDMDMGAVLPTLLADPTALQQVLVNLVQNAIHALSHSERKPRKVTIRAHMVAEAVVVSVSDNGPGVPAPLAARVFEPFFTTKSAGHGTGLGLAVSRAVAREHGGELSLDMERREGASFVLRLPVRQAPLSPSESGTPDGEEAPLPGSVLVVDDEASVRESLVAQIGHLGSRVESAGDAQEAQRMLSMGAYDVVLLDVRMPGASGLELHQTLLSRNPEQAHRVVFMTGDLVNDDVLAQLRSTGNPYLEKPFTIDELRQALRRTPPPTGPRGRESLMAGHFLSTIR